jgi:hypothetical protein
MRDDEDVLGATRLSDHTEPSLSSLSLLACSLHEQERAKHTLS